MTSRNIWKKTYIRYLVAAIYSFNVSQCEGQEENEQRGVHQDEQGHQRQQGSTPRVPGGHL